MIESPFSQILLVKTPSLANIDATLVTSWEKAKSLLKQKPFKVIVAPIETTKEALSFFHDLQRQPFLTQKILIEKGQVASKDILACSQLQTFLTILSNPSPEEIEKHILLSLRKYDLITQKDAALDVLQQQIQKMKYSIRDTKHQIMQKEKKLKNSIKRLESSFQSTENLQEIFLDIHSAQSIGELESLLFNSLKKHIDLSWSRLFFGPATSVEEHLHHNKDFHVIQLPMTNTFPLKEGRLVFAKKEPFKKRETDFLSQVEEVVSLVFDHLSKIERLENLKQQWEATFDSITVPLCLTNPDFSIIKANLSFSKLIQQPIKEVPGKNCFTLCQLPIPKSIPPKPYKVQRSINNGLPQTFEVSIQKIEDPHQDFLLIFLNDITEQIHMEEKILESAKMVEVGTISSSIAHELNNPLAGMLSFAQLIKMSPTKNKAFKEDIQQIEKAILRCKDIIENLLEFSRPSNESQPQKFDLIESLKKAVKIMELQ
ncbi:MAG: PAS domain-containing protein, partial [Bdellovibrio sp.]